MDVADFDYELPPECIAQHPVEPRDSSRLMTLDPRTGNVAHHRFHELDRFLRPGDVLVMNDTRVIPARLAARKRDSGGAVEILLLRQIDALYWLALLRGKGLRVGTGLQLTKGNIDAEVVKWREGGQRVLRFSRSINASLDRIGQTPLPPYIQAPLADAGRYQTVYSRHPGSAAAPTAGLHFTPEMLKRLEDMGVQLAHCTLHIGLDTFQPLRVSRVSDHRMHSERAVLDAANANRINAAVRAGGRVVAVGTTSARTLESAAGVGEPGDRVGAFCGDTSLFITPGYRWRAVDALLSNFHLPRSTLLMMVSALAGRENVLRAYAAARDCGYRFYSFGDAMLICPQTGG